MGIFYIYGLDDDFLEYPLYSSVLKNVRTGKHTKTEIKLDHACDEINITSPLGIIILGQQIEEKYNGFWIYSKTLYTCLYRYDKRFISIFVHENHILVHDNDGMLQNLGFLHLLEPTESLELVSKKTLPGRWKKVKLHYPLVADLLRPQKLINVETNKNVLEQITEDLTDYYMEDINDKYCIIEDKTKASFLVFETSNFKKPPLVILGANEQKTYLSKATFFKFNADDSNFLDCYNLVTGKSNQVSIEAVDHVVRITDKYLFGGCYENDKVDVYAWRSNHIELVFITSIMTPSFGLKNHFPSFFPFTFLCYFRGMFYKASVYSRVWKEVSFFSIFESIIYDVQFDSNAMLYYICSKRSSFYLNVLDFKPS